MIANCSDLPQIKVPDNFIFAKSIKYLFIYFIFWQIKVYTAFFMLKNYNNNSLENSIYHHDR